MDILSHRGTKDVFVPHRQGQRRRHLSDQNVRRDNQARQPHLHRALPPQRATGHDARHLVNLSVSHAARTQCVEETHHKHSEVGGIMEKLQIFENAQFGKIRTAGTSEKPLFCLADVCKVLDLRTDNTKQRLKEDGLYSIGVTDRLGRQQETTFISEQMLKRVKYLDIVNISTIFTKKLEIWIFRNLTKEPSARCGICTLRTVKHRLNLKVRVISSSAQSLQCMKSLTGRNSA